MRATADELAAKLEANLKALHESEIDALARRVRWAAEPRVAPGTRIATSAIKFADPHQGGLPVAQV